MKYIFDNTEYDEEFHFEIEAPSIEDAIEKIRENFERRGMWEVVRQEGDINAVNLYLQDHLVDILFISESPSTNLL